MNYNEALLQDDIAFDARTTLPRHNSKRWRRRKPEALKGLVVHQSLGASDAEPNARYHVGQNHISNNGLPGLCYTLFIERSGLVLLCNDVQAVTLSQGYKDREGDENSEFLAVCVGGNFHSDAYQGTEEPSFAQILSLLSLFRRVKEIWGWHNSDLYGHYHFGKPACPGRTLSAIIDAIRADRDWSKSLEGSKIDLTTIAGRQQALSQLGYDVGEVDGIWGHRSKSALVAFQADAGISVDGIFGAQSASAIGAALAQSPGL